MAFNKRESNRGVGNVGNRQGRPGQGGPVFNAKGSYNPRSNMAVSQSLFDLFDELDGMVSVNLKLISEEDGKLYY